MHGAREKRILTISMTIEFSPNGNYLIALSQEPLTKAGAPYRIELYELPHGDFFTGLGLEREFREERDSRVATLGFLGELTLARARR